MVLLVITVGTAINLIPSFYFAKYISSLSQHFRRTIFFLVFLLAAVTLHLNYRIPGVYNDITDNHPISYEIIKPIHTYIGSSVSVDINHNNIQYKPKYLESTWLDLESTWLGDYSFRNVSVKSDYFIYNLKSKGFKIENDTNAPIRIVGHIDKNSTHHTINIKVIKDAVKVAEYSNKFRVSFAGEQSKSTLIQLALTLQQSTFTRMLFPDYWRENEYPNRPVSSFLEKVFILAPKPELLDATPYVVSSYITKPNNYLLSKEELRFKKNHCTHNDKRISIDRRFVKNQSSIRKSKKEREGWWINIYDNTNKTNLKKYLQAPNTEQYQHSYIHQTTCEDGYFNVMASFMGIGMSEKEWMSTYAKSTITHISSISTPIEKELYSQERKRVKIHNDKKRKNNKRNVWLLRYNYDGKLKEAINFMLPNYSPEHVNTIKQLSLDKWLYTGFDMEKRQENEKHNRYKISDYVITIKKK